MKKLLILAGLLGCLEVEARTTFGGPTLGPVGGAFSSVTSANATNASGTGSAMQTNDARAISLPNSGNQVSGTFTGNGSGLTNLINLGYNSITVGGTNYPNLDTAIPAANGCGLPVVMSAGNFPITNYYTVVVPIIGVGPQTHIFAHTLYPGSFFPNFSFATNGVTNEFDNFSIYSVFDYGSLSTNLNPYQSIFGIPQTYTNNLSYPFNAIFNNVVAYSTGTDIIYLNTYNAATYSGGLLVFNNCALYANWDGLAITIPNITVKAYNSIFSQQQVNGGTTYQLGLGNGINLSTANGCYCYLQNCFISANNTNSYGIYIYNRGNPILPITLTLVNCVVTNWTGTTNDPINYLNLSTYQTRTNYVNIVGGDVNPFGISFHNQSTGKSFVSCTPMTQYSIHTPTAVTVGSSVFSFTNTTFQPMECYLQGTAAYSISKNGVSVAMGITNADYLILQPSGIIGLTYSSTAPTLLTNTW